MPTNGDFLPPEFWYWSTIGLGFMFVSGAWFIIKAYISKLDITLKAIVENISKLTKNQSEMQSFQQHQEEIIEKQDKRIEKLEDKIYPVRHRK